MHVLLAQESRVLRTFSRKVLATLPHPLISVEELRDSAELCRSLAPSLDSGTLLLLDSNLPGLHVPTFLRLLRARGILERLSILLLVSAKQVPLAQAAVRQGIKGYLVRPFPDEALAAKIGEILQENPPAPPRAAAETIQRLARVNRGCEGLPLLLQLPSMLMAELLGRRAVRHYEPGTVIVRDGDRIEQLSFVTMGEVEVRGGDSQLQVRGSGECFGERAFICGEPARIVVTARTAVSTASISKIAVTDLALRHPAVMDFLKALLTQPTSSDEEGSSEIQGSLSALAFPDLLQHLHSARKTGVLVLEDEGKTGRIYLDHGDVLDARAEGERGEGAFHRLGAWSNAKFDFRVGAPVAARTITRSTMSLVLDLFRGLEQDSAGGGDLSLAPRAAAG
jgi:CRP-like cAMP-binding protein/DNA-binding NarL/FixJ family response regulator